MHDGMQYTRAKVKIKARALEIWKSFHFQKLSPSPFTMELATDHWFLN